MPNSWPKARILEGDTLESPKAPSSGPVPPTVTSMSFSYFGVNNTTGQILGLKGQICENHLRPGPGPNPSLSAVAVTGIFCSYGINHLTNTESLAQGMPPNIINVLPAFFCSHRIL